MHGVTLNDVQNVIEYFRSINEDARSIFKKIIYLKRQKPLMYLQRCFSIIIKKIHVIQYNDDTFYL